MLWHLEIAFQFILVGMLWKWPDGRPKFAGLMVANFLMEMAMVGAQRSGRYSATVNIWYWCVLLEIPLIALALIEAGKLVPFRPSHTFILSWWIAGTMGCAWIRFYPWTGEAAIVINSVAFMAWIIAKVADDSPMLYPRRKS